MTSTAIPKTIVRKGTVETEIQNPWWLAWRRFRRHRAAVVALAGLFTILLYIWLGGLFFSKGLCEPTGQYLTSEAYANCNDLAKKLQPPSSEHPFGTDTIGRDILARTIYGGQISLTIGLFAAIVEVIVGVLVGAVAGYFGGWIDDVLMRFTEAMLIIPSLFLLLVLSKSFGGSVPP